MHHPARDHRQEETTTRPALLRRRGRGVHFDLTIDVARVLHGAAGASVVVHVPVVELAGEGIGMVLAERNIEHRTNRLEAFLAHELVAFTAADVKPWDAFATIFREQDHLGAIGVEFQASTRVRDMNAHVGGLGRGDAQTRRAGIVESLVLQDSGLDSGQLVE